MKIIPPGPATLKGIDVSHHQGAINWSALPADVAFAFVRCSDGIAHPDRRFAANWPALRKRGIVRGVYQYLRPAVSVREQVELMVRMLEAAGGLLPDDLPPVVDVEKFGNEAIPPAQMRAAAAGWIRLCEELTGRRPIVYTGPSVQAANDLGSVPEIVACPLWVAHYTARPGPWIAEPWTDWTFWQHTGAGRLPGITGNVDLNIFNGSLDELRKLAADSQIGTAPPSDPEIIDDSPETPPSEHRPEDHPMNVLVYLAHADPSMRARYEQAVARAGISMDLVFVNRQGLSSVYRALAAELRGPDGRMLPGLLRRYPPPLPVGRYDGIVLANFSAGYGLATTILQNPADAAELAVVVAIDGWHAGFDADGTAKDADLAPLLAYALRAKEDRCVCAIGHSDVPTHSPAPPGQKPKDGYASTTEVANELLRLAGGAGGGLMVEAHNEVGGDNPFSGARTEHGLALTKWGAGWLAKALLELQRQQAENPPPPRPVPPWQDGHLPLGERALLVARAEQAAGVREIPGPGHNKEIQKYFTGCERDGKLVDGQYVSDETAWCIAAAGWCMEQAALPGDVLPHKRRLAVREAWSDAVANGCAWPAEAIRRGDYTPQPGDVWIGVRAGNAAGPENNPFGPTGSRGHAGRICSFDGEGFDTLDANINDTWTDCRRPLADPAFVGVIAYPRPEQLPAPPDPMNVEILRRFIELSDAAAAGHDGMDAMPMDY